MRKNHSLFQQLFPGFILLAVCSALAVGWLAERAFHHFYFQQVAEELQRRAQLAVVQLEGRVPGTAPAGLSGLFKRWSSATQTRFTLIQPDGKVLADSEADPAGMENHANRPEVQRALQGRIGMAQHLSWTLNREMMYVAVPVHQGNQVIAVLRVALALKEIAQTFYGILGKIILGGLGIIAAALAISWFLGRRITKPLQTLQYGANAYARGEFHYKIDRQEISEFAALAQSLGAMAQQLDERFKTIQQQRQEQETVFAGMQEGVLVVDADGRLLRLNPAAAGLLGQAADKVQGRHMTEIIRNPELQALVNHVLAEQKARVAEITLSNQLEQVMRVSGAPLQDASQANLGAVIVLNDMTRQKKLENLRKEFVANVSHELKTPVTVIQGYVETLLDGEKELSPDARRFLDIIMVNSQRLHAIIEDLLQLSRLENANVLPIAGTPVIVANCLRQAVSDCAVLAQRKKIIVEISCPPETTLKANANLLEQALVNLLANAINASQPQGRILLQSSSEAGGVVIRVQDFGCGIPAEHLPRLFERFYRVEKSRSRTDGGTGLGLAIVKHIMQAHGGRVEVQSTVNAGSTFTLFFPPDNSMP